MDMFSANHRQHLLVAFKNLDESLAEVLECLAPASGGRLFQPYTDELDGSVREHAEAIVADVYRELREFMATHQMPAPLPTHSGRHAAYARASVALVAAIELDARRLRGYGELSQDECEALDSLSQQLSERLTRLVATLADDGEPPSKDSLERPHQT
jgi:hypothetical protein